MPSGVWIFKHYFWWASNQTPCQKIIATLRWRHNGRDSVSNHQPHDYSLNRLCRRRSKKTSKLRVTGLCAGKSPGTGEFSAQMASNAQNVSIWWRHHELAWILSWVCLINLGYRKPFTWSRRGDNIQNCCWWGVAIFCCTWAYFVSSFPVSVLNTKNIIVFVGIVYWNLINSQELCWEWKI